MTTTTPSLRSMSNRNSIMQRRFKQHPQHRTPPRGGADSTIDSSQDSEYKDNNNNHTAAPIINSNTSYESRDSTITSQSGDDDDSSEITERANNMASSRMMKTAGIEGVAATAADVISACTYEEEEEDDDVVNGGVDDEEHEEEEIEVRKEDGGTELYMLIEKALWDEVCERIEEYPKEAKIWVTSSGKDDTLFSWDVWRRLPLHEVRKKTKKRENRLCCTHYFIYISLDL